MQYPNAQDSADIENFMIKLQDYPSPIPDSVIKHICAESGLNTTDARVTSAISVVTQKFISEVLRNCSDFAKARAAQENPGKIRKLDLQFSDLKQALAKRGIHVNRPEFIVSLPQKTDNNNKM